MARRLALLREPDLDPVLDVQGFQRTLGRPFPAHATATGPLLDASVRPPCDLPHLHFHDPRHLSATLPLAEGAHPKIVSERPGRSSVAVTHDVYSHVTMAMQEVAVATLDAVLPGSRNAAKADDAPAAT